jgi:hypothetical protein
VPIPQLAQLAQQPVLLAEASSTSLGFGGPTKTNEDGGFFGEFILGIVLISLALPMVWMNERKQVKVFNIIEKARKAVVQVDVQNPMVDDNYKLVQAMGRVKTQKPAVDERFNVSKDDTVKICRTVEVLQWVEKSKSG